MVSGTKDATTLNVRVSDLPSHAEAAVALIVKNKILGNSCIELSPASALMLSSELLKAAEKALLINKTKAAAIKSAKIIKLFP